MTDPGLAPRMLTLALLALAAGPALFELSRRARALLPALDGFVVGSVGTLVLFFLLPEAVEHAGGWALLAAFIGLASLSAMERIGHLRTERVHTLGRVLAIAGLFLHMVLDGVAVHGGDGALLGAAVILHRLPVAVTLWWMMRPRFGVPAAIAVLVAGAVATYAGYAVGGQTLAVLDGPAAALFQSFVAGALLHIVFHGGVSHGPDATWRGLRVASAGGAALGVGVVALLPAMGAAEASLTSWASRFLDLALETAPALVFGYLAAGLVAVFLPVAGLAWLARGGPLAQAAKGTAFGIPIPICSCGVVPLYSSIVHRGAPPAAALAFLVATPELGIESIFLSIPLLGGELTAARLACAFIAALAVGWFVGRRTAPLPVRDDVEQTEAHKPPGTRVLAALRYGFVDVVGDTAAWILAGLALAAAVDPGSVSEISGALPPGVDVLLAAVIGMPLYVCASGATPLAAALLYAGLSPGAAIAFLLAGPATNVTTFGVLSKLHGKRTAASFAAALVVLAVGLGIGVNVLLGTDVTSGIAPTHLDEHGVLAWMALAVVGIAYAWAVVRQGPSRFLEQVVTFAGQGHDHDHDHDHDPDDTPHGSDGSACC